MDFDFDPFSHFDLNNDSLVDYQDLKLWELKSPLPIDLNNLNADALADVYQAGDLNNDGISDFIQVDLNNNSILDSLESKVFGASLQIDMNGDGVVDSLDEALFKLLLSR